MFFTKADLQRNQWKHKQLPPQTDFAILQDGTLKPVNYLIKHGEVLPHQKMTLIQFLLIMVHINFQYESMIKETIFLLKSLKSFSYKSVTPFQTKFKTPVKKDKKSLHQQSLFLNDTDITSDDVEHIYTRIPKHDSSFTTDKTLHEETYFTIEITTSTTPQESTSAINVQTHSRPATHCSQTIPFYDTSFFKYKKYFQGFFLPDDYSLDLKSLQQQPEDPVLRTVYTWLTRNEKRESLTPLTTGTPVTCLLQSFSQLSIEDSTNLINLYTTNTNSPATNHTSSRTIIRDTIRI